MKKKKEENLQIKTPQKWRKGQTIFNFLEWVAQRAGYDTSQSIRMADPFNIDDAELEKLYKLFLSRYDV